MGMIMAKATREAAMVFPLLVPPYRCIPVNPQCKVRDDLFLGESLLYPINDGEREAR
jgi:hypothetical protein